VDAATLDEAIGYSIHLGLRVSHKVDCVHATCPYWRQVSGDTKPDFGPVERSDTVPLNSIHAKISCGEEQ
jgi:hypothetical protein